MWVPAPKQDVVTPEQAVIAERAGAVAVMALERVPADIRKDGGVARYVTDATHAKPSRDVLQQDERPTDDQRYPRGNICCFILFGR